MTNAPPAAPTVIDVLRDLARHPERHLLARWNWKSALLSAVMRAALFFTVNLKAGRDAALAALITDVWFRLLISGFYGSLTQSFRRAEPAWQASLLTMLLLPAISHAMEFAWHWWHGTRRLGASILASVIFTAVSTLFNLFAMRRGVLLVDEGRRPLREDLRRMPGVVADFLLVVPLSLWRTLRAR